MKESWVIWILVILVVLVVIFQIGSFREDPGVTSEIDYDVESVFVEEWANVELEDVRTGESFKISDFEGKPILLESFAVWCPTCTSQQREIKKLHDEIGNDIVSISLDTDPNEDTSKVLEHLDRNGFDWYYAVVSADTTRALIDDFGQGFVNAPQAPVVLINTNGQARKLDNGLKRVEELKSEIDKE